MWHIVSVNYYSLVSWDNFSSKSGCSITLILEFFSWENHFMTFAVLYKLLVWCAFTLAHKSQVSPTLFWLNLPDGDTRCSLLERGGLSVWATDHLGILSIIPSWYPPETTKLEPLECGHGILACYLYSSRVQGDTLAGWNQSNQFIRAHTVPASVHRAGEDGSRRASSHCILNSSLSIICCCSVPLELPPMPAQRWHHLLWQWKTMAPYSLHLLIFAQVLQHLPLA